MEFNVINENNVFKMGNVISVFKLPYSDREIVLFTVEDYDSDKGNLEVAYLNKGSDGYDYITQIDDDRVLKDATMVVRDMMGVINNG